MISRLLYLGIALAVLAGCRMTAVAEGVVATELARGAEFSGVTVLGERIIVAHEGDEEYSSVFSELLPDGQLSRLDLADVPGCDRNRFYRPTPLPDGRLGAVRQCITSGVPSQYEIIAISDDLSTETLAAAPARVSQFAWLPDMSRGLAGIGSLICQTVVWLSGEQVAPLDAVIVENGETYAIDAGADTGSRDCPDLVRADLPAPSPDGSRMAFFAAPGSLGTGGQGRLDAASNVYLMSIGEREATPLVRDVLHPQSMRWSPDGSRLAFSGTVAGTDGTWVVGLQTPEDPQRVYEVALGSLAWSPDGRQLLGLLRDENDETAIVRLQGDALEPRDD